MIKDCSSTAGRPLNRHLRFFLLLGLVLFLCHGCLPKKTSTPELPGKLEQDLEEIVHEPYIPRDDGVPLSAAEYKAFNSRGEIDARLSQEDAEIVELHFKFFVHQHRKTFERYLERTARFLPHIRQVFEERGIPLEIAYLAMVESGGNPNAVSPAGAAGLWQFMPFTGRKFGLRQNTWLDERRDPFKATYAAADYLLKLYSDFGDWYLAVAAYNAGEGKIGRALNGTGAKDFFELCRLDDMLEEKQRLKQETRQYVPRLLAMAKIMRNLEELGFREPSPDEAWVVETLEIPPGTNLAALARSVDLTWAEFATMNPAFKRTASPPTSTTIAYILPDKQEAALKWLASSDSLSYAGWKEYTVRKGDTLSGISKRNNITIAALREANNFTKLPRAGTIILIPGKGQSVEPVFDALPSGSTQAAASAGHYVVRPGDTLFALAKAWGTDVDSIRLANRMGPKDTSIKPGQRISIPGNSRNIPASSRSSAPSNSSYVVKQGDSLFAISRARGVTLQALCEANGLTRDSKIKPGQVLKIPAKGQAAASAQPARTSQPRQSSGSPSAASAAGKTVTIVQGDTLFSLARKHGTTVEALRAANKMGSSNALRVGQKLRIP